MVSTFSLAKMPGGITRRREYGKRRGEGQAWASRGAGRGGWEEVVRAGGGVRECGAGSQRGWGGVDHRRVLVTTRGAVEVACGDKRNGRSQR